MKAARIGGIAVAAVLLLYVLSIGPVWRYADLSIRTGWPSDRWLTTYQTIYTPVFWLCDRWDGAWEVLAWYEARWEERAR